MASKFKPVEGPLAKRVEKLERLVASKASTEEIRTAVKKIGRIGPEHGGLSAQLSDKACKKLRASGISV